MRQLGLDVRRVERGSFRGQKRLNSRQGNRARGGAAHRVSGARQRTDGVEKYSSIASRQAPEHGSKASSPGPDSTISSAIFSAQLMQIPARSIPQPVQLQVDL